MKLKILSKTGGKLQEYLPNVTHDFTLFEDWFLSEDWVAHDLETNMTETILDREMLVATYYAGDVCWVIFVKELNATELAKLCALMTYGKFLVQNAKFEYKMWKKYGVDFNHFYDTYLTEKLLGMGHNNWRADLASIVKKYLDIDMPKELQTSFVDNISITDAQVKYAVYDVLFLAKVRELQEDEIEEHDTKFKKLITKNKTRGLKKANWWNHEFIKVLADMEYYGIKLNVEKWKALYYKSLPLVTAAVKHLDRILFEDFYVLSVAAGYIFDKDTPKDKLYSSAANKLNLLQIVFPDLENTSQVELRKYLCKHDTDWPEGVTPNSKKAEPYITTITNSKFTFIKLILLGRTSDVTNQFVKHFRDEMVERELLIPKDSVRINWGSHVQRMEVFRWISPGLTSTDKDHMEEIAYKHRLLSVYLEEYQGAIGKVTKFGLNYLEHVEADGRVRTNINPVLNTGRISSSNPNVLNIVNDKDYRACFEAEEGNKFIMSDYKSEELVITAIMTKEKTWLDAIKAGHDLHSVNSERIFGNEWEQGTEIDCEYQKTKDKCKCKKHKHLRSNSKQISFGIIYGLSKFGAAFRLKITEDQAQDLIDAFYDASPGVKPYFSKVGRFALSHAYTPESAFGTCRFVNPREIHYDKNSIIRKAGNFTIQGLGAAILKVCTVLLRRHIKHMGHHAWIVLTPYDEVIMEGAGDLAEYYKVKLQYYMELAGKLALRQDILKADIPVIGDYWIH